MKILDLSYSNVSIDIEKYRNKYVNTNENQKS